MELVVWGLLSVWFVVCLEYLEYTSWRLEDICVLVFVVWFGLSAVLRLNINKLNIICFLHTDN